MQRITLLNVTANAIQRNELKELIKSMRQSKVSKFIDAIILSLLTVIVLGAVNLLISLYIG